MRTGCSIVVTAVAVCLATQVAAADDRWSEQTSFRRSDVASLKVRVRAGAADDPDGYKVTLKLGDDAVSDTVPAVFRIPNADAFYAVTFTAPNGATWTKKIEVRRHFVTELRVDHEADEKAKDARPARPARTFIGKVENNSSGCNMRLPMKVELVDAAGEVAATSEVKHGFLRTEKVPAGTYGARLYVRYSGRKDYTFEKARNVTIERDGWKVTTGCGSAGVDVFFEK